MRPLREGSSQPFRHRWRQEQNTGKADHRLAEIHLLGPGERGRLRIQPRPCRDQHQRDPVEQRRARPAIGQHQDTGRGQHRQRNDPEQQLLLPGLQPHRAQETDCARVLLGQRDAEHQQRASQMQDRRAQQPMEIDQRIGPLHFDQHRARDHHDRSDERHAQPFGLRPVVERTEHEDAGECTEANREQRERDEIERLENLLQRARRQWQREDQCQRHQRHAHLEQAHRVPTGIRGEFGQQHPRQRPAHHDHRQDSGDRDLEALSGGNGLQHVKKAEARQRGRGAAAQEGHDDRGMQIVHPEVEHHRQHEADDPDLGEAAQAELVADADQHQRHRGARRHEGGHHPISVVRGCVQIARKLRQVGRDEAGGKRLRQRHEDGGAGIDEPLGRGMVRLRRRGGLGRGLRLGGLSLCGLVLRDLGVVDRSRLGPHALARRYRFGSRRTRVRAVDVANLGVHSPRILSRLACILSIVSRARATSSASIPS